MPETGLAVFVDDKPLSHPPSHPKLMKICLLLLLAALCGLGTDASLAAQSAEFTYQGRLNQNGVPASGIFDLQFGLFAVPSGGVPVSGVVTHSAVGVSNGLFTVLLNFGSAAFDAGDRWLDIAARPAGSGSFTSLTPRQPVTPVPYALTALRALEVPGISGHSLHAAEDGPRDAVYVDAIGNVGLGTTSPAARLHVTSEPGQAAPPRLESRTADGFNAGWDFYHGAVGKGFIGVPDAGAFIAPGELIVYGGPGTPVTLWPGGVRALTADLNGNVGIGTTTPGAKLEVRGDVRLGAQGELQALAGEERLRVVRGSFNADGTIVAGRGFTVERDDSRYTITFDRAFADTPSITATTDTSREALSVLVRVAEAGAASVVLLAASDSDGPYVNRPLHFIAIGSR